MEQKNKKMLYFLIGCLSLSIIIIGATYAYFTASVRDEETVKGNSATVTFGLSVEKVTTVDMAYGLIPMKNDRSPYAAEKKCLDDLNNAVCQIYRMTITADSDTVMFLDGYVVVTPKDERLETRFSNVYTDDEEVNFYTKYTSEDFGQANFEENKVIKTGACNILDNNTLNHTNGSNCLLVENEKIGGESGRTKVFYTMIWVYDNGEAQDYLQGMELAYRGEVTFVTAEGNEISATFD